MSSFQTVRWHANNSVFPQRAVRFAPPAFCLFTAIQVRKGSGRESVRCLFELVSSGCDYNFLKRLIDVFIRIGYNKRSRNGKAASQIWFSIIKKERRRLLFHQIFNPENGFFSSISKFMDIVGLSVVWLIACLPVITIGPATAALYYSVVKCVRRDEKHPYRNFWRSFQTNWKMGSLLTLLCLPAGIFLYWEHGMLRTLASGGDKVLMGSYIAMRVPMLAAPAAFTVRVQSWRPSVERVSAHIPLSARFDRAGSAYFLIRYADNSPVVFPAFCRHAGSDGPARFFSSRAGSEKMYLHGFFPGKRR